MSACSAPGSRVQSVSPTALPRREPDLTSEQEDGLFEFVSGGKGLVGIHGTAWWIGGRAVDLIGGARQLASAG